MMNHFIASDSPVNVQFLTLGTTIVVFILFLLLTMKFVWPHILKGLDQRDQKLRDDLNAKGPVKLSDVEGAQKEILTIARRLADSGEIMLGGGGEAMV